VPNFDDSPLTDQERRFLQALDAHGVRWVVVGLSAAVLQGADTATQDIDLWVESLSADGIASAARTAGGFYSTRTQPPMVGGEGLERIDLVTHCHGLATFDAEYPATKTVRVGEVTLRVLPLERIIASKEAANRPKDRAVLPQLRAALAAIRAK